MADDPNHPGPPSWTPVSGEDVHARVMFLTEDRPDNASSENGRILQRAAFNSGVLAAIRSMYPWETRETLARSHFGKLLVTEPDPNAALEGRVPKGKT